MELGESRISAWTGLGRARKLANNVEIKDSLTHCPMVVPISIMGLPPFYPESPLAHQFPALRLERARCDGSLAAVEWFEVGLTVGQMTLWRRRGNPGSQGTGRITYLQG